MRLNSRLAFHLRAVAGSLIGGIAETQEVLDFCGKHCITADVEVIPMELINDAFKKVKKGGVRYRYVIDIETRLIHILRFWGGASLITHHPL